jgi:hypothetical protein
MSMPTAGGFAGGFNAGQSSPMNKPNAFGGGMGTRVGSPSFGAPNSGPFGGSQTQPVFGQQTQQTTFGQPQPQTPFGSTPSAFGQTPGGFSMASAISTPFGGQAQQQSTVFGAPTQSTIAPFGAPTQSTVGPFGAPTQSTVGPFGAPTQSTVGPFGAPTQSTGFGTPAQSTIGQTQIGMGSQVWNIHINIFNFNIFVSQFGNNTMGRGSSSPSSGFGRNNTSMTMSGNMGTGNPAFQAVSVIIFYLVICHQIILILIIMVLFNSVRRLSGLIIKIRK